MYKMEYVQYLSHNTPDGGAVGLKKHHSAGITGDSTHAVLHRYFYSKLPLCCVRTHSPASVICL